VSALWEEECQVWLKMLDGVQKELDPKNFKNESSYYTQCRHKAVLQFLEAKKNGKTPVQTNSHFMCFYCQREFRNSHSYQSHEKMHRMFTKTPAPAPEENEGKLEEKEVN
jgi:hypothetical protein